MSEHDLNDDKTTLRGTARRLGRIASILLVALAAGVAGQWLGQEGLVAAPWSKQAEKSRVANETPVPDTARASSSSPSPVAEPERKILYYRNPMGLPDTSPSPKKDWMGMDYIPVYAGEATEDGSTVKLSVDRVQRSGVRTEKVVRRSLASALRLPAVVEMDERRIRTVALRFDAYVEELFVNATEQHVQAGQPLFRLYSQPLQLAQVDLAYAWRENKARGTPPEGDRVVESAMIRMRNFAVPESRIREVRETGANPRTIDWPSPATGVVIEKKVLQGQRVQAGDELFRIADLGNVWIIAEVPERDLAGIRVGDPASVRFTALPGDERKGTVAFVYHHVNMETRTARVRIELPNPDMRIKIGMYAEATIGSGAGEAVIAVPESAVIDSGTRQVVIVVRGEGRFEPRPVRLGRHAEGMVEVLDGVAEQDEIVTTATFLIDAESNLRAALQAFTPPEPPK